ncbi:hypothetical protein DENIS_1624 [Desulfonema ishimotonii]|uniref:Uncharacterized protein n=1 Tax=Desulfonema ishimotonii TaxID=45657 RepID=A0A401FUK3_9BACT|nr:hypothetical protein DENIS_1624 [Desulfonema ishimotonii]
MDTSAGRIPEWLIEEWQEIHAIEPQLFPDKNLISHIPFYSVPHSRLAESYLELCEAFGDNVSHVFLIPWLVRGGADLVALNYIRALHGRFAKNIVVITTLPHDSVWQKRLPKKVRFIEFGKKYAFLSGEEKEKLLTRLLLQMAPEVIHNINSELGYDIFIKYGQALKTVSRLYACSFCGDVSAEGGRVGYPFGHLPACFDHLTAVLTDNCWHVEDMHRIYALDRKKMIVHYQPAPNTVREMQTDEACPSEGRLKKETMDIVWAGRLDRQKRPDILLEIARRCQHMPFRFHVYGSFVLDRDRVIEKKFKAAENLTYHGTFDGLPNIRGIFDYDLFLNTSQWDGLPNILLEAISLGLPVVSSDAGGICELIRHDMTGFLISPYDHVDAYVDCLKKIYADRSVLSEIAEAARTLVQSRHSWESFVNTMKEIPGYCQT